MSKHPLIELSASRDVRQAKGFAQAAAGLTGESLAKDFELEKANAPRRAEAGKKYFVAKSGRYAKERRSGRDEEHLAQALATHCESTGEGIALPPEGALRVLDHQTPLRTAAPDKAAGDADPNFGASPLDALGTLDDDRLAVVKLKFVAPSASRTGTGDTPLRALIEGLASVATVEANAAAIRAELLEKYGRVSNEQPPVLLLIASPRYWELCRKREAQKGAAWIKEMERLATEIEASTGVAVRYLAAKLTGDPGWSYPNEAPRLDAAPGIVAAWEAGAGRVRPKPKPRPKSSAPADAIVEADLTRPVRSYALTDSFEAGDRIDHPTLGTGVVQGGAGRGKIEVLFDGRKSLLVHERPAPSPQQ